LYIPRKNGKTTLAAGLADYITFTDPERGAENYSAAADREQARLVFEQAVYMARRNPSLRRRARILTRAIIRKDGNAVYKPVSADAPRKHGFNLHFAVVDELHAHKKRDLVDVLLTSTGSRTQPLVVHLTTADLIRPSICNQKLKYAQNVRDGIIDDPAFFPLLWDTPADADWEDEQVWKRANPNLGVSIDLRYLRREYLRALSEPDYEPTFRRLHLNQQVSTAITWIKLADWDACNSELAADALIGKPCWAGLDMSATEDITAFVLFFPEQCALIPFFWAPKEIAQLRTERDKLDYLGWHKQGFLNLIDMPVIDYDLVFAACLEIRKRYRIKGIALDRWNAAHMASKFQNEEINVVPFGQGYQSMSEPAKQFYKLIKAKRLRHGGSPVLRWMANNTMIIRDDADNIKPTKKRSPDRIDGIVGAIMAVGMHMLDQPDAQSVYEDHGVWHPDDVNLDATPDWTPDTPWMPESDYDQELAELYADDWDE